MNTHELLRTRFIYPFPTLCNPYAEEFQQITDNDWIDGESLWIFENDHKTRETFKRVRTAYMTAWWYPTASYERVKPLCRLLLWTLYNDDIYEYSTPEEFKVVKERSLAVLRGEISGEDSKILLGNQLALLRNELQKFLSAKSVNRFAAMIDRYLTGVEWEAEFKAEKRIPTVEEWTRIREYSICVYPFYHLIELCTGVTLPTEIYNHPILLRLQVLASHIIVYFNEVQSLLKDEPVNGIYYNLVRIIQRTHNLSLEDACLEMLRIHNEELQEFVTIQSSLPDFGEWQEAVINWVHHISFTLSGWKAVSLDLVRYNTDDYVTSDIMRETMKSDLSSGNN
ncbi:terpene synthase family protein [Parapedobacter tibetensis]|uniref:terpene synthase family protein n=1 Tax=Parapedobacter tibetensis TaxID=2972951 RepID=UPI00214D5FD0|nr:hypothetical protein [Parapedobacter tibetensis]